MVSKVFNTIGYGGSGDSTFPKIIVDTVKGSTVTCTKGDKVLTLQESNGKCIFEIPSFGTWFVESSTSGINNTKVVIVSEVTNYNVSILP